MNCKGTDGRHSWAMVLSGNPKFGPCGQPPTYVCQKHWWRCRNCDQTKAMRWEECLENTVRKS